MIPRAAAARPSIINYSLVLAFAIIASLALFWPLLGQPRILDDVDIQAIMSGDIQGSLGVVFVNLLRRCTLAHQFRPLAAPVYLAINAVFGASAIPLRIAVILFDLWAEIGIFRVAKSLSGRAGVGFFAAVMYASSWAHWDCMAVASNMPQAVAHALLWQSLWMFVREDAEWGMLDAVRGLAPVTMGLFFKEDVVVFPMFVLAASFFMPHLRLRLKQLSLLLSAWVMGYCSLRLMLPNPFTSTNSYLHFNLARMLNIGDYSRAYSLLIVPLTGALPPDESLLRFAGFWRSDAGIAASWTVAITALGVCLGRFAWNYSTDKVDEGSRQVNAAGVAVISLVGSAASIMTYAVFGAVQPWNSHRLLIAWGAMSVGGGFMLHLFCCRLAVRRWMQPVFMLFGAWLFLKTAIAYRFPDPSLSTFSRLYLLYETRQAVARIHENISTASTSEDEFVFEGFDPLLRIPEHLRISEGRAFNVRLPQAGLARDPVRGWRIRRHTVSGQVILTMTRFPGSVRRQYVRPSKITL